MTLLLALWAQCPDALTADFHRFYGGSPEGLIRRGVPLLEVADCARWLPTESAVWRAVNPPDPDDAWTLEAQLLAGIHDRLAELIYVQQRKAGGKPPRPKPIPRPGVRPDRDITKFGGEGALPLPEMAEWLGWPTDTE